MTARFQALTPPPTRRPSRDKELVPRIMMRAMLILCLSILGLVTAAQITDRPMEATPPDRAVVASREIHLSGDMSGAVTVRDSEGELIADLAPDAGGFISGVWRVIQRKRTTNRVAIDGPVVLRRHDGGRLSIMDPSTGWHADLMGFGRDNSAAFFRLLPADGEAQ